MTSLDAVRYKKELRRLGLISNFRGKVGTAETQLNITQSNYTI